MAPKRYGAGQYRYFHAPYPEPIEELKQALYPKLLPIARDWWTKLGRNTPWPDDLDEWLAACHAVGQTRSTALMLKYGTNDWNALHQDLYGELVFPLQVVINLSDPDTYTGGEFLLVEQRYRAQSRGIAMQLPHGHGFVFTTRDRPVQTHPRLVCRAGAPRRIDHPFRRAVCDGADLSRRGLNRHFGNALFTDSRSGSPGAPRTRRRSRTRRCSTTPGRGAAGRGCPARRPGPAAAAS